MSGDPQRESERGAEGVHERQYRFALARFERWALPRLAASLPRWVLPDDLTVLGLLASTGIGVSYMLTNQNPAWLWVASALLLVQWFGDSLDGTLARVRGIERPRYGFYLDHITDAYSTFAIGLGLGLSPFMLLSVALANVIAYLVMSINVYLETHVFSEFSFGYGLLGPTEVRVVLIGLNTAALLWGTLPFGVRGVPATMYDIVGVITFVAMFGLLLFRVARNLKTLGRLEPPGTRRP